MARVVVAGSFDSKAEPFGLLIEKLRAKGEDPIVIDTSVFPGDPSVAYPAPAVAARAGRSHRDLPALGRAEAVGIMASGAAAILAGLQGRGEVGALVCMGGSNAATVFSQLAPVLPLGIPKIVMTTSVAGDTRPMMGANDVVMIYPVVDVDGGNTILRRMIERLAGAAVALKTSETFAERKRVRKSVALSMYGVTTPCVQRVSRRVERMGLDAFVFHANGTGGRSIETFAAQGPRRWHRRRNPGGTGQRASWRRFSRWLRPVAERRREWCSSGDRPGRHRHDCVRTQVDGARAV